MSLHDAPGTSQDVPATHRYVPMGEAVSILGVSASTIRRRIAAGELDAERVPRPQGTALWVKVSGTSQDTPGARQDAPETPHHAPGATTDLTAIIGPLVAELVASRQTIVSLANELRTLERENGELRAENTALAVEHSKSGISGYGAIGPASQPSPWPELAHARAWAVSVGLVLVIVAGLSLVLTLVFGAGVWR